ncbi:tyrosine-type recombinase/integrase [Methylacidiphilum caldifontis]|nr:tyrosine-type recombinase/integrase [Methylacidiphilum caldifontis]
MKGARILPKIPVVEKPLPPRRRPNREARTREYLTPPEAEGLIEAAGKAGWNGPRDAALLLLAYRHGLRVSELVCLRWEQVDLTAALLHVRRAKNGISATHPLRGRELRVFSIAGSGSTPVARAPRDDAAHVIILSPQPKSRTRASLSSPISSRIRRYSIISVMAPSEVARQVS